MSVTLKRGLPVLLVSACVAIGAVSIARFASANAGDVPLGTLDWRYAALSMLTAGAFVMVYAASWWLLIGELQRRRTPFVPAARLFLLAWPGRYLPASAGYYGGRLVAGPRIGLSRAAVAASLVYENLFAMATGGTLAVVLLAIGARGMFGGTVAVAAAACAALASLCALHPACMRIAVRVGARRVKRLAAIEECVLGLRSTLLVALAYTAGALLAGLSFYFAARAVAAEPPPLLYALAVYNVAGVAGMLAIAVPGGIGAREGVVVAMMSAVLSPTTALGAAVLVRLVWIVADVAPAAAIVLAHLARRLAGQLTAAPQEAGVAKERAA